MDDLVCQPASDLGFLAGGGEMGVLMRGHDWSASPLGAPSAWPQSLRSVVGLILTSKFPMFVAWGPELGFLYNDAYAEILGAKHPAALGARFKGIWSEIWSDISPLIDAALAGQGTYHEDLPLVVNRKGFDEQAWFTFSYSPVRDESGRVAGMYCAVAETTGRVLTESALAESEARLRALTDNLPAGMVYQIATGPDGNERRFLYVSQSHEKLTGWPAHAVLADPTLPYRLILPEDRQRLAEAEAQSLREMGLFDVEARLRRADGEVRWCRIISAPRKQADGSLIWDGIQIDVTEHKEGEVRLRELNESLEQRVAERTRELERVWHHSQDLQVVVDGEGIFRAVSPAATRLLGWLPEEMIGRPLFDFTHPDGHVGRAEKLAGALAGPTETHLNRYRDKAGNYHWISWITTPADDLIYCSGRDVTVEIERQAELEVAQEALRQSQKMEAMGQLTGGVAHDFNNLLTPIIGSLDRLLTRGVGSERERRLMDGALQSAERAKVLVQRLLAFARRQPLQPGPVDVRRLVSEMAELIASTVGPRIDVRLDMPEDLPPALADANQLEMALLNLAVNARDAMPNAGVLAISAEHVTVRTGRRTKLRPGPYVRLSVKDTGVGMDEATLARAVEPFFSTKGIGKGTGLGLSMVHGLALQLGGTLTIDSHLGEGTTVELWLPISMGAVGEGSQASNSAGTTKAQGMALLVDDEDLVRLSTADMLMDLGYEVVEANSAEEALSLIGEGLRPHLVVTDHLMPGLTGLDLARDLRLRRPDLPVLIVSGYAEMDGIASGFARLTKPFRSAELMASLAALMPDGRE
ncbi:PAS domain S-box protein [Rubellimicrobium roseum]|uniref:histidine kinase n=1 Tax=Rubellimicrobium roseum TaxID=687525 RepID=A0A5C4N5F1_9RHOB|nr:PAS domain S-box protein [Rubellimicrobium roseum]TNC59316.1 PAS domain S-box protein [Rubellimicrobium roseum]